MTEPQNKLSSERAATTGLRLTDSAESPTVVTDAAPVSTEGTRLKIVTVPPDGDAFCDTELPTGSRRTREDLYLGVTIDGRYKVDAVLGEGGMGVVYRCTHTIIGKKVAMKVLRADMARDSEVTERFLNEAKAASAIGNPHIIDISDFGQFPDGSTYFIMEYLNGAPLSKVLEGGQRVAERRLVHIARQLAEGLAAAHAANIVHRDLKPDNIVLIERGAETDFVKILDFGIAKVSSATSGKLTRAGAVFGTPHYMSPEQAAGAPVDPRGDIYALGVIMYEMSSGHVPFDADNFMAILSQHLHKTPVPIRSSVPELAEVTPGLEAIVLKCLSKRPEDRYQSMLELVADLDKFSAGLAPDAVAELASRAKLAERDARTHSRQSKRWMLAAMAIGALSAAAVVATLLGRDGERPREGRAARPVATQAAAATPAVVPPSAARERVVIASDPLDAHVFRGDADLGVSPVVLELAPGESVELSIRRAGYKEATLAVDGKTPRYVVELERAQRGSAQRATLRATRGAVDRTPSAGNNGIVDPWDRR